MNSAAVARNDIPSVYFGIEMSIFYKTTKMFFGEEYVMPHNNKVISKKDVKEIAIDFFKEQLSEYTELYLSCDSMRLDEVIDYMGKPVFTDLDGSLQGWLVFFDPCIFMNWEHSCVYMFIVNKECQEIIHHTRPFIEGIQMDIIN